MSRILIIEDDEDINRLLEKVLTAGGYETVSAFSGTEARLLLERELPDLILLDLMLPGLKGEEVIGYVREERKSSIPVIILSARQGIADKVSLLKLGADDYVTKPFEPEELLARVMAALRRSRGYDGSMEPENGTGGPEALCYKNLTLHPDARTVRVCGRELALTRHEYDILFLLLQQPRKVFSRESLYEQVWENGYYGEDNTVNVHVSNIRKKLAAVDGENEYIKTVWGIGFKMA